MFFHISDYPQGRTRPKIDQIVCFDRQNSERGERAVNITPLSAGAFPQLSTGLVLSTCASILFFVIVLALTIEKSIPVYSPAIYGVTSVLAFSLYGLDKRYSRTGAWRISEQTLHFFSVLGGWPGAMVAQQFFRHKSQKTSFRVVFWITVAINCLVVTVVAIVGVEAVTTWLTDQINR